VEGVLKSFGIEGSILLWQIVNFGILFAILSFFFYKPMKKILKEREARVTDSMTKAQELEKKATELEAEFKRKMSDQRKEIEEMHKRFLTQQTKLEKEMKEHAEQETQKIVAEAKKSAEEEKAHILKSLEQEIHKTAVALAAKILEREIDEQTQKKLIEQALRELQNKV